MRSLSSFFFIIIGFWATAQSTRCPLLDLPQTNIHQDLIETRADLITIPIVFHLFEESGFSDSITDEQIYSQIDVLNELFNGAAIDLSKVPSEYRDRIASPQIEFCLAEEDAILRKSSSTDNLADLFNGQTRAIHYSALGGSNPVDVNRYLNVWVANSQNFAARSSFPSAELDPQEDGIIIDPDFLGITDRAAQNRPFHLGKTLAHEIGHYLGLAHIWGSGAGGDCQNDDGIEDTPDQIAPYRGCITRTEESCGSTDLTSNIMDFSDDDCLNVFTTDQVHVMRAAIAQFRPGLESECIVVPDHQMSVYRNEFNMIRLIAPCTGTIRLYDFQGQLIQEVKRNHINGPSYLSYPRRGGIYIVELQCTDNRYVEKIVLE